LYYVDKMNFNLVESFESHRPWSSEGRIVAFIDGDNAKTKPNEWALHDRSVQIIVASSPKGATSAKEWIKDLLSQRGLITLTTNLWSRRELFVTGLV